MGIVVIVGTQIGTTLILMAEFIAMADMVDITVRATGMDATIGERANFEHVSPKGKLEALTEGFGVD